MAENKVICSVCGKVFKDAQVFSAETGQALGCAAVIDENGAEGHYGSIRHDLRVYSWVKRPETVRDGIACDDCVTELVESGHLRLDPSRPALWDRASLAILFGDADTDGI
jgi:hypothetical protein